MAKIQDWKLWEDSYKFINMDLNPSLWVLVYYNSLVNVDKGRIKIMQQVYGNYLNAGEARIAVDELLNQGYRCEQIKVISNQGLDEDLNCSNEPRVDERNMWERIKDSFTFEQHNDSYWKRGLNNSERILLKSYKKNLQEGETMILVEGKPGVLKGVDVNQDTLIKEDLNNHLNDENVTVDTSRIDEESLEE